MKIEIGQAVQQGEVYIRRLAEAPSTTGLAPVARGKTGYVLSHSERGHNHTLSGGELLERPARAEGLDCFYAILDNPEQVIQEAASDAHAPYDLEPGFYDIRISREHNPFTQQARRVAD